MPVKHRRSDSFSPEPKPVKQARASSPKQTSKKRVSPDDGVRGRERGEAKNRHSRAVPSPPPRENKRGRKRSPSDSSISDDSLSLSPSPPPIKVGSMLYVLGGGRGAVSNY